MDRRALLASVSVGAFATLLPSPSLAATGGEGGVLRLGVCYYPEQWAESQWASDAKAMAARGISRVRIAEFAWTLMEPRRGQFDWGWLDRVIATLAAEGLGVVLGTPTATPPYWMTAELPEILPQGADGRVKGFGSRRYYTFSSVRYRQECVRIAGAMAARYGRHPAVVGWQIDNEYGCHDTTYSYGPVDLEGFRTWLIHRYENVERLNEAWGAVVWSQQLTSFDEVDLPVSTPYDPSPAKLLDFRRFASSQVEEFNAAQVKVIRPLSPGRFVTTNFLSNFVEFDHFPIGDSLDFASWDSYPLGVAAGQTDTRWDRTGNPDVTGWNHDLMRAINPAPFWIMEQQPGPVNWARFNEVPLLGMVRLWAWEAFAHGAATVSFFRWRQGRVGQEQMHAGLNNSDGEITQGGRESVEVAQEIVKLGPVPATSRGDVALMFDYETAWMSEIQPNGEGQSHLKHAQSWYSALRALGLDVDVVRPGSDLSRYRLVVVPSVSVIGDRLLRSLDRYHGLVIAGPRTGSKSQDFARSTEASGNSFRNYLPVKVLQVATMRTGTKVAVEGSSLSGNAMRWREWIQSTLPVIAQYGDGGPAVVGNKRVWYVGCEGDEPLTLSLMRSAARSVGIATIDLPDGVRLRRRGNLTFAFNYGPGTWSVPVEPSRVMVGASRILPQSLAVWR